MSALGQKRTSTLQNLMSALPPIADIRRLGGDVRFVPIADIVDLSLTTALPARTPGHPTSVGSSFTEPDGSLGGCPLSGVKRTSKFVVLKSAYDPKRTSVAGRVWSRGRSLRAQNGERVRLYRHRRAIARQGSADDRDVYRVVEVAGGLVESVVTLAGLSSVFSALVEVPVVMVVRSSCRWSCSYTR